MAAPPDVTMRDFQGFWVMDKALSDPLEPALALQGIPWILRKIINIAAISMFVTQEVDEMQVEIVTVDQTATGGIKAETEVRKLDWSETTSASAIFGTTGRRARWTTLAEAEGIDGGPLDAWLTEGWIEDEDMSDRKWLLDVVENKTMHWTVEQLWGFAKVNGDRYHVRKTLVRRGEEVARARTVYDWRGRMRG